MARIAGSVVCLAVVVVVGHGLATGQPWLLRPVPPWSIPLGNLATWLGLVALALLAAVSVRHHRRLRVPAGLGVAAAGAWFPVSVLLSGNLATTFHGEQRLIWIWRGFTAIAAGLPLVLLAAAGVVWMLSIRRRALD